VKLIPNLTLIKLGFDACSLSSLTWEEDMLRDDFTQFIVEKDNALYLMEIKHSKLHIRSLISSNLNVYASHFEMINLIEGNIQTNDPIDCTNPPMMSFPLIYSFHQSHGLHPHFCDRILGWLEYSYIKKFHNEDKVVLALFLPKYLGSRRDIFLLDPPCEEINEHLENCQEDGAFQPWLMVIPFPHNPDKFFKLLTLAHAIMTLITTRLHNGWRIRTTRISKEMVRSCLLCF
jgi:hypothetical protein